ncbi:MAG TPA: MFS transporter [Baekduia sp.]|nr:MFS transporter [Baekduia sp.]
MSAARNALRAGGFAPLAGTYALNELGDSFGVVALAVLVLDRTDSALATTALFLLGKFLPALLAPALTAGLDRRPVSRSLPALYVVEALAFAGLAVLAGAFWLPAVLVLAFLDGLLAITARGLSRGAVAAALAPADALRDGNAVINVIFAATSVGGPVLAGVLVHTWSAATALWVDAASFLAAALVLLAAARRLPVPEPGPREHWLARVRDGLRYVRSHPTAGRLILGEAVAIIFFTITVPIEVVYAEQSLGTTSLGFGVLLSSWGVGILLGSVIFARAKERSTAALVLASTAAVGLGYAGMAVAPTLAVACLGSIVGGTGNGIQWVAVMTALQESVGDDYQARAAGLLESMAAAVPGVGFVIGGVLTSVVDARVAYGVAAAGVAVVVAAWARRPLVPAAVVAGEPAA